MGGSEAGQAGFYLQLTLDPWGDAAATAAHSLLGAAQLMELLLLPPLGHEQL